MFCWGKCIELGEMYRIPYIRNKHWTFFNGKAQNVYTADLASKITFKNLQLCSIKIKEATPPGRHMQPLYFLVSHFSFPIFHFPFFISHFPLPRVPTFRSSAGYKGHRSELFFWREVSDVNTMASRRPLSARNVDHTQGKGKQKKERYPFALLDRATLVQNLRHLTKDSSFPVNVCEDDLLKPTVSAVTLIIICSHRGIFKPTWQYFVVVMIVQSSLFKVPLHCPFGMAIIYRTRAHKFSSLQCEEQSTPRILDTSS